MGKKKHIAEGDIEHSRYFYDFDRNMPYSQYKPKTPQQDKVIDLELKAINEALQDAKQWDLTVEIVWSSLKAMKKSKGCISILTALQQGKSEWDI